MGKWDANTNHKFLRLPNADIFRYNLWDARATAELFFALRRELQEPSMGNQWAYYQEWIQPLQVAVLNMSKRGLLLDRPAKARLQSAISRELTDTDRQIRAYAKEVGFSHTDKFPNASQQVGRLLFDHLGLRGGKKTASGQWSADQDALTRALRDLRKRDESTRPLLHWLFHRSRLETVRARYFNLPLDDDGRVRPRVKITGTKTFRYAYETPPLQQYPPEIRRVFHATPGHLIVSVDYSQLEARILAILAGDDTSLKVFMEGGDVHRQNACDLFGLDERAWEALADQRKPHRNFAKTFLYGLSYGGKAESMKTKLFCPCPRCADKVPQTVEMGRNALKEAEDRWFQAHPAVRRWQSQLCSDIRRDHYYESPFGLRRWISQPWGSDLERQVKNLPMQMNGALLMNQAQVRLDREQVPVIFQMHDAFVIEVPEGQVDQVVSTTRAIMEDSVPALGGHRFPVDVEVGKNWGAAGPSNPDGLKEY